MKVTEVQITMEKTYRTSMKFEATEEQLEMLKSGVNPFEKEMEENLSKGDVEYGFAAFDENDRLIKDWD